MLLLLVLMMRPLSMVPLRLPVSLAVQQRSCGLQASCRCEPETCSSLITSELPSSRPMVTCTRGQSQLLSWLLLGHENMALLAVCSRSAGRATNFRHINDRHSPSYTAEQRSHRSAQLERMQLVTKVCRVTPPFPP